MYIPMIHVLLLRWPFVYMNSTTKKKHWNMPARPNFWMEKKFVSQRRIQSQILVEMELYEDAARILSQTMREFP